MLNEMIRVQGLDDAPSGDHWRWLTVEFISVNLTCDREAVNAPVGSRISPQQLTASRSH
jgi:hypothetical protein